MSIYSIKLKIVSKFMDTLASILLTCDGLNSEGLVDIVNYIFG